MKIWMLVIGSFVLTLTAARLAVVNSAESPLRWWFFWVGIAAATAGSTGVFFSGIGQIFRRLLKLAIAGILLWALEKAELSNSRLARLLQWAGLTHDPNGDRGIVPDFSRKQEMQMLTGWLAVSIGAAFIFASRSGLRSGAIP